MIARPELRPSLMQVKMMTSPACAALHNLPLFIGEYAFPAGRTCSSCSRWIPLSLPLPWSLRD